MAGANPRQQITTSRLVGPGRERRIGINEEKEEKEMEAEKRRLRKFALSAASVETAAGVAARPAFSQRRA